MERVNKILNHPKYKDYLNRINIHEETREYCKHNMEHFLDMARISYILSLESKLKVDKEIIYSIALLHDIGRWVQYEEGTPHEKASYELSRDILIDCNFNREEIEIILDGILNHRNKENTGLNRIAYLSDKLSRNCFNCKKSSTCNWSLEKKNLNIQY